MITMLCVPENYDQHLEFSLGLQQKSLNENGCLTPLRLVSITHFTVAGENEAGVDLVLIQPFLLYYVNHVFLMLTSIF